MFYINLAQVNLEIIHFYIKCSDSYFTSCEALKYLFVLFISSPERCEP